MDFGHEPWVSSCADGDNELIHDHQNKWSEKGTFSTQKAKKVELQKSLFCAKSPLLVFLIDQDYLLLSKKMLVVKKRKTFFKAYGR